MPYLCISGGFPDALFARTEITFANGDLIAIAISWIAMLVAMMSPLLSDPLLHVERQSLRHRQWRSIALFLAGYLVVWLVTGATLVLVAVAVQAGLDQVPVAPFVLGIVLAGIWQSTPFKQRCLNGCHRHPSLAAFGARADAEAILFGVSHGCWCVGSCWAFMLCTILVSGPFHWVVMVVVLICSLVERSRGPQPPRWLAALPFKQVFSRHLSLLSRGAR
ncbi:copper chaperone [Rhizobium ruizarguesonis]|uniref:copper chaperone n=1 Tax=Rhizobium ruizarguesonis TaxID=2081791 RepID=UPI0037CACBB1